MGGLFAATESRVLRNKQTNKQSLSVKLEAFRHTYVGRPKRKRKQTSKPTGFRSRTA